MEIGTFNSDDEGEDVILEGSPLYEYLIESCPDDKFGSFRAAKASNGEGSLASQGHCNKNETQRRSVKETLQRCQDLTSRFIKYLFAGMEASEFTSFIKYTSLSRHCSLANSSRCVTSGDTSILDSYLRISQKHPPMSRGKILAWLVTFVVLLCCQGWLIWSICQATITKHRSGEAFSCALILHYSSLSVLASIILWQVGILVQMLCLWQSQLQRDRCFSHFLDVHTAFGDVLRRAVLYVQEVEVIQRGYTMMTPFTPVCHLERGNHTHLQCPALRQAVFRLARNQFISLRRSMLDILSHSPLMEETDGGMEDVYLATTDLAYLAGETTILTDESLGPQPTSHLKIISNLYSDQLSEFITRYIIGQCPDLLQEKGPTFGKSQVLGRVVLTADQDLSDLQTSLDLHLPRPLSGATDQPMMMTRKEEEKERKSREIWGPQDVLTSAARALRLHADIIASRADSLHSETAGSKGDQPLSGPEVTRLEELLSEVKGHIEACQTCVHEAGVSVAKLSGERIKVGCINTEVSKEGNENPQSSTPCQEPIDLMAVKEDEINFIDEEVFEAYIDPERDDSIPDYNMDDLIEERKKQKRDSEDAKHLLMELHSVLSRREEEKEKMREERRKIKGGSGGGESTERRDYIEKLGEIEDGSEGGDGEDEDGNGDDIDASDALLGDGDEGPAIQDKDEGCLSHVNTHGAYINQEDVGMEMRKAGATSYENGGAQQTDSLADESSHLCQVPDEKESDPEVAQNMAVDDDTSGFGENVNVIPRPIPKPRRSLQSKLKPPGHTSVIAQGTDRKTSLLARESATDIVSQVDESPSVGHIPGGIDRLRGKEAPRESDNDNMDLDVDDVDRDIRWSQKNVAIPFMQGLAAEAVRMSRERQSLAEDTFGD